MKCRQLRPAAVEAVVRQRRVIRKFNLQRWRLKASFQSSAVHVLRQLFGSAILRALSKERERGWEVNTDIQGWDLTRLET
jgi:hypothetical protein